MSARNWRLGVDVGGTFTDVVAQGPDGLRTAKTPTLATAPAAALGRALAAVGLGWDDLGEVVHGTTMVTNALVEGRLARTALVATRGFVDTIEIGRASRMYLYHLDRRPKPLPLVARELRVEVDERVDHQGRVLQPLLEPEIDRVVAKLAALDVASVAVCLLHAYVNPAHELQLGEALARHFPHVALSHRISPEAREFERMTTTVASAAVMPEVRRFVTAMTAPPADVCRHHFVHSANGMAAGAVVREQPILLAMSGPAAGVAAATATALRLGAADVLTFDMGGTTTDVCLVREGRPEMSADRRLAGHRLRLPMVAVESIGAGGGSIARLVDGALQVGPDSAGADPGPAAYGKGGAAPTVTDADLVLGRMGAERRLGDAIDLDPGRARDAVEGLARVSGMSVERCALGILEVAHSQMSRALRRVTVERGVDARDLPLVAYGGAGPMHAAELAQSLGITRVIVPRLSSGLAAFGAVTSATRVARQRTLSAAGATFDTDALAEAVAAMLAELRAEIGDGVDPAALRSHVVAMVRYRGQSFEIAVHAPDLVSAVGLRRQFERLHQDIYGFVSDDPIVLVALRVEVERPAPPMGAHGLAPASPDASAAASAAVRQAWFEPSGPVAMGCLGRADLRHGVVHDGPLVVEDAWTTVVVPPGCRLRLEAEGHLSIEVPVG